MDHRQLLRALACGRVVVGATLLIAPARAGGRWLGPVTRQRGAAVAIRALAVRDLAIGAGTLDALANGTPVRPWALAGAAGDLVDAAATLAALRQVGIRRGLPVVAVALIAGAYSLSAADQVDLVG